MPAFFLLDIVYKDFPLSVYSGIFFIFCYCFYTHNQFIWNK